MQSREVTIMNELGLHAKASAAFVRLANQFGSGVTVEANGKRVNGKSIMGLLMLAASKNSRILITARGDDAVEAVDSLSQLVMSKFGDEE
ncbi:MAG: HPr family phosphocarrier protein [bacterium]